MGYTTLFFSFIFDLNNSKTNEYVVKITFYQECFYNTVNASPVTEGEVMKK
jgi:hypothetical protein